jgi:hypothetical protein
VRKANVSGTKNGSEEAVSALIQELIESKTEATTIGAQGRISCTYWGATVGALSIHSHSPDGAAV